MSRDSLTDQDVRDELRNTLELSPLDISALESPSRARRDLRPRIEAFMGGLLSALAEESAPPAVAYRISSERRSGTDRHYAVVTPELPILGTVQDAPKAGPEGEAPQRAGVWSALSAPTEGVGLQFRDSPLALLFTVYLDKKENALFATLWFGTGDRRLFWTAWPPGGQRYSATRFTKMFEERSGAIDRVLGELAKKHHVAPQPPNGEERVRRFLDGMAANERGALLGVELLERRYDLHDTAGWPANAIRVADVRDALKAAYELVPLCTDASCIAE